MSIMRSAREFFFGPDDEAYYEYDEASDYDRREGYREPGVRDDVRDGGYRDLPPRREAVAARDYGYDREPLRETSGARGREYDGYQTAVAPQVASAPAVNPNPTVVPCLWSAMTRPAKWVRLSATAMLWFLKSPMQSGAWPSALLISLRGCALPFVGR